MAPRERIRRSLEHHAPLSDAQLCWMMRVGWGISAGTTKALRYRMMKRGEIRFAKRTTVTSRGQAVKLWELDPGYRPRSHGERKERRG